MGLISAKVAEIPPCRNTGVKYPLQIREGRKMGTLFGYPSEEKKWWAVKRKTHRRWFAFRVSARRLETLKDGYEFRGPFGSLATTLFAVNQDKDG
jgi:hypothetical protein